MKFIIARTIDIFVPEIKLLDRLKSEVPTTCACQGSLLSAYKLEFDFVRHSVLDVYHFSFFDQYHNQDIKISIPWVGLYERLRMVEEASISYQDTGLFAFGFNWFVTVTGSFKTGLLRNSKFRLAIAYDRCACYGNGVFA